jgi:hypothetical protein
MTCHVDPGCDRPGFDDPQPAITIMPTRNDHLETLTRLDRNGSAAFALLGTGTPSPNPGAELHALAN